VGLAQEHSVETEPHSDAGRARRRADRGLDVAEHRYQDVPGSLWGDRRALFRLHAVPAEPDLSAAYEPEPTRAGRLRRRVDRRAEREARRDPAPPVRQAR